MNKIRELTNKWEDISCSWTGILNIVKMVTLPNVIYRHYEVPIRSSMAFLQK